MVGGDITMTKMEKLLNKLKKAKLKTPKPSYFEQYLYNLDVKRVWKNKKSRATVNEFYAAKYELWQNRLIKRVFYVEQCWLNKEKQYCNIYEVQRFLAGSPQKLNKWIYSASSGGVRNKYWISYEKSDWEVNAVDRMVCSSFYNYSREIGFHYMNGYENFLKNSEQKYSGFEFSGLGEEQLFWYLYQYEKHPQMEMFSKMGVMDVVLRNFNCIKWSQKGYKALGLNSKEELDAVRLCARYGGLKYYRKHKEDIKRFHIDTLEKLEIYNVLHNRHYENISSKAINYINEQRHIRFGASYYLDYIRFCNELGLVMNSETKYPKDLREAHDELNKKIKVKNSMEETQKIQKQVVEKLFKYRYAKGGFVITPANSVEDLISESKGLNHCVKTYATKYSKGETAIFLVRKKDDVLTPFYTLELKDGQVHQIRGKNNCDPTDKVKDFVDKWAKKFKIKPLVHQGF